MRRCFDGVCCHFIFVENSEETIENYWSGIKIFVRQPKWEQQRGGLAASAKSITEEDAEDGEQCSANTGQGSRSDHWQAGPGGKHWRLGDVDSATCVYFLELVLLDLLQTLDQQAGVRGYLGINDTFLTIKFLYHHFQLDYVLQKNMWEKWKSLENYSQNSHFILLKVSIYNHEYRIFTLFKTYISFL